ncbi:MAG: rhodanese-like domain-containing protein [Bdellovibrionota bacterium]
MKPTQINEESANQYNKNIVLVDTRSSFEFAGFHFSGSVNLNTESFLILKNPKTKKRILDPDITQIIERLAKRGISPLKSVILISNKKDSNENKKWNWLLRKLEIANVTMMGFDEFRVLNKNRVPKAPPESEPVWGIVDVQIILKNADQCFVNWSDESCF